MVQQNWAEFSNSVSNTSGGTVGYGNDCSGFTSICWKLPTREVPAEISSLPLLAEHCYTITRYRVTLRVHDGAGLGKNFRPAEGEIWQEADAVLALAMPSPFRRVIERLLVEN